MAVLLFDHDQYRRFLVPVGRWLAIQDDLYPWLDEHAPTHAMMGGATTEQGGFFVELRISDPDEAFAFKMRWC